MFFPSLSSCNSCWPKVGSLQLFQARHVQERRKLQIFARFSCRTKRRKDQYLRRRTRWEERWYVARRYIADVDVIDFTNGPCFGRLNHISDVGPPPSFSFTETMADWDQAQLEEAIAKKEKGNQNRATDIVCKQILVVWWCDVSPYFGICICFYIYILHTYTMADLQIFLGCCRKKSLWLVLGMS